MREHLKMSTETKKLFFLLFLLCCHNKSVYGSSDCQYTKIWETANLLNIQYSNNELKSEDIKAFFDNAISCSKEAIQLARVITGQISSVYIPDISSVGIALGIFSSAYQFGKLWDLHTQEKDTLQELRRLGAENKEVEFKLASVERRLDFSRSQLLQYFAGNLEILFGEEDELEKDLYATKEILLDVHNLLEIQIKKFDHLKAKWKQARDEANAGVKQSFYCVFGSVLLHAFTPRRPILVVTIGSIVSGILFKRSADSNEEKSNKFDELGICFIKQLQRVQDCELRLGEGERDLKILKRDLPKKARERLLIIKS